VSFDPRNREVMLLLGPKQNSPNALNDLRVAPGFARIVGEQADAVLTASDDGDILPTGCSRD